MGKDSPSMHLEETETASLEAEGAAERPEKTESDVNSVGSNTKLSGAENPEEKLSLGTSSVVVPSGLEGEISFSSNSNPGSKEASSRIQDYVPPNAEEGSSCKGQSSLRTKVVADPIDDSSGLLHTRPAKTEGRLSRQATGSFVSCNIGARNISVANPTTVSGHETCHEAPPFRVAGVQMSTNDALVSIPPDPSSTTDARKLFKKRVRRVGVSAPRKQLKSEFPVPSVSVDNATTVAPVSVAASLPDSIPRVKSKHDEKWNVMFDKLVAYKGERNSTLVPQCYDQDPRLGRWVHYQRVEYWIYQQSGNGKITPDRIARLEAVGFEWDPQRAQWNNMFEKLTRFKEEIGHCKVPKGYTKDPELANWVRNQRLEHANMAKGKKSRMTEDRFRKLDTLGFKWSTAMPSKHVSNSSSSGERQTDEDTCSVTGKDPREGDPVTAEGTVVAASKGERRTTVAEETTRSWETQPLSELAVCARVAGNLSTSTTPGGVRGSLLGGGTQTNSTVPYDSSAPSRGSKTNGADADLPSADAAHFTEV